MLALNLLPPETKKEIIARRINQVIKNNLLFLFVTATIITVSLLWGRIFLDNQFITTVNNTSQVSKRINSPLTADVHTINQTLQTITKIQQEFIPWPTVLFELGSVTPPAVIISNIQITQESATLQIRGLALTRSAFLQFKEDLEKNNLFTNIKSPVQNLLAQKNINFNLEITLNLESLQWN